jgi:CubicO group peptidase (beta-lactamase class C family)
MGKRRFRLVVFLSVLLASAGLSGQAPDVAARLQSIVDEERERSQTPGISAALLVDGVVAEAFSGLAHRETPVPVSPDTVFGAASVSKLFTAVLVMRQAERGKLSLDEPANRWLEPEFQIRDAEGRPVPATLRQLLTHTSGLPVNWGGNDEGVSGPPQSLKSRTTTTRAPGEKIVYANAGYELLGYLAAKADGEEFSVHVQRVLLTPLGMTNSSFRRAEVEARVASGYGAMFFLARCLITPSRRGRCSSK